MCQEIYEHDELKHEIALKKAHILKSDLIIAVSENTKNDILHFYPVVDPEKIKVIYEAPVKIDNVKEISGLPDKYILYVGQREKYKNFLFFIDSICDLLKEDKDLYVVCLGPECSENENNTFEKLGISNKVKFFKINDEELNFAYQNARCMVYPSLYEGFGLPVLEAMQNGCPCVISNTSSLPEVGGNAAMYFDPTNKIDINEKVNKMLNDKSLNIKYSKMGLERVKDFS